MKIILAQNSTYKPMINGASLSNRALCEGLVRMGNQCLVIAPSPRSVGFQKYAALIEQMGGIEDSRTSPSSGIDVSIQQGVLVHAVREASKIRTHLLRQCAEFSPDLVLITSEDPSQMLLESVLEVCPEKVVYIVLTVLTLPFGPGSMVQSAAKTALLKRAAGILTLSRFMKDYLKEHGGLDSEVLHFPVYGAGPHPLHGRYDGGGVTLVNPCAFKGLPIFLELARRMPELEFCAVPTWGTTDEDRAALGEAKNVRTLNASSRIDDILERTRVLLAPSLWYEAFGQIVVEAMLRGIPVLASDSGGLPEAKLGIEYVLPVRKIEKFVERNRANRLVLEPEVPDQEIGPWEEALRDVLSSRSRYEQLSRESREAAERFVGGLGIEGFEKYLESVCKGTNRASAAEEVQKTFAGPREQVPEAKRALLAALLRKRSLS